MRRSIAVPVLAVLAALLGGGLAACGSSADVEREPVEALETDPPDADEPTDAYPEGTGGHREHGGGGGAERLEPSGDHEPHRQGPDRGAHRTGRPRRCRRRRARSPGQQPRCSSPSRARARSSSALTRTQPSGPRSGVASTTSTSAATQRSNSIRARVTW